MKKVVALWLVFIGTTAHAQYWQQKVDYTIEVKLNDKDKTLDGFEKIIYTNNSPDTLRYIWFHVWPNAFKNDRTAFNDQRLENGSTSFYFAPKEKRGYINKLDFKANGITAKVEDHPEHIDIIKIVLPKPLLPKQQITITTPFHVKLPSYFSRSGYQDDAFQIAQWYPKPAVYDQKGWHPMPYLDQGEFYSNFGSFDVRITLPKNYVVAATGELQDQDEKSWLKGLVQSNKNNSSNEEKPKLSLKKEIPPSSSELKTLHYKQSNVHDFAWFADKTFLIDQDTCRLSSGRIIEVYSFYTPIQRNIWKNSIQLTKDALRFLSEEVGEYPYDIMSVVQGPASSFSGGMEYPTITLISPAISPKVLDQIIAHEVFHNWFQQILATNERTHPWMDEGLTSFYEDKYMTEKYGPQGRGSELLLQTKAFRKTDQPIETPAHEFSSVNYGVVAYHKTAEWLRFLEEKYSKEAIRKMIRHYYDQWKFRHPYPEDFIAVAKADLPGSEPLLEIKNDKGIMPGRELTGFTVITPFKKNSLKHFIDSPSKNTLVLSPTIGLNKYDGLMIGGLITNYKLPPNRFQFLFSPLFATRSKKLAGLGRINLSLHSNSAIRKLDLFLNGSSFSMDDFKDTAGTNIFMRFSKLAPGIRLTFREKTARSTVEKYVQWKTFFINEQSLRITPDTAITGTDTALLLRYNTPWQNSTISQLRFVYQNFRTLYPFDFTVNVDQGKSFIRPTITANYFFNYEEGGGLNVRFFAGKFLYTGSKTIKKQFETDRYHLNMTGPNGYEDYTYSDYFFGRNEFEGLASQQIMIRDGGFKVRTDLLASKVGKTDDWLVAFNFNTTLPRSINPLSVLPIQIPLRLFVDIGTYADAWERNAEADRFLFDAGIHLPLFKETVNVYIPLVYNKVYGDYFKSTIPKNRFFKTISFSIDLFNKNLRDINRQLEFQ
jgi:hypothetical protein